MDVSRLPGALKAGRSQAPAYRVPGLQRQDRSFIGPIVGGAASGFRRQLDGRTVSGAQGIRCSPLAPDPGFLHQVRAAAGCFMGVSA